MSINREQVQNHFNYLMCIMMLGRATEKGKLTQNKLISMKEVIEDSKEKETQKKMTRWYQI
jgi:hypothetical protein